jgi:6-phosphogluconolactonase (cycloisomerase 2 family)
MSPEYAMIKRYDIPHSRLPFVNAEIERTEFAAEPHLVSSIWGGTPGGKIYFWNPDTGSKAVRDLPDGLPGAYMLRTGSDGSLYLGCGNGDLYRYVPSSDAFQALVQDELKGITWGGCVTDRYAVWAASPGHVGVYDYREDKLVKVFRPMDTEEPTALYGHRAAATPDGRVVVALDVPQARFVFLELGSMEVVSLTPSHLEGVGSTGDLTFWDNETVVAFVGSELHVMSYPDLQLKHRIPRPAAGGVGGRACMVGGRFYAYCAADGGLYSLDPHGGGWEIVVEELTSGGIATLHPWGEDIGCLHVSGVTATYRPASGAVDRLDLESTGPMLAHALCAVPNENLVVGAPFINQRFWTIDLDSGDGRDCGQAAPGGGQINQIIWEPITRRALLSSYTSASVTAFDPSSPPDWPNNPTLLASANSEHQMRPMALQHDGEFVWMATSPEYGNLGGALSRIDPRTGAIKIWRHLVQDQKVNALALDPERRRVYCSTEIYGDANSAPPTQTTGYLVAFDMDELEIVRQQPINENSPSVRVDVVLPNGNVLAHQEGRFYAWNAEEGSLTELGPVPNAFSELIRDPETDRLWASAEGSVGRLEVMDGVRFHPEFAEKGAYLHIVNRTLYFAVGYEVVAMSLSGSFNSRCH